MLDPGRMFCYSRIKLNNVPDEDVLLSKPERVAIAAAPLSWLSEFKNLTLQVARPASSHPWTNRK